ncbi:MAG: DNA methyltransferase [Cyanobacteria bacterium P01_C01_bin.120]
MADHRIYGRARLARRPKPDVTKRKAYAMQQSCNSAIAALQPKNESNTTTLKARSRLILGDCINVLKTLPGHSIDLVVTDPPYLINYKARDGRSIMNDSNKDWVFPAFQEITRVLKNDAFMVSFYGWNKAHHFLRVWQKLGLRPVGHFACIKSYASKRGFTEMSHENAYLLAKGNPSKPVSAPRDVLAMPYSGNRLHPTQKPIELLSRFIRAYSKQGDTILDPFAGSASTAVAAKSLGRECIAIEKDPQYFTIAKQRVLARAA